MIEFNLKGEKLWQRMERAVEKVNERLLETIQILAIAKVPYAVIGGHAVRVLLCGRIEREGEPNPDIEPSTRAGNFQTVPLETLVRMKLNAFRRKDQMHLLDMISLGMIDHSWLERYPTNLSERLKELLNDPEG